MLRVRTSAQPGCLAAPDKAVALAQVSHLPAPLHVKHLLRVSRHSRVSRRSIPAGRYIRWQQQRVTGHASQAVLQHHQPCCPNLLSCRQGAPLCPTLPAELQHILTSLMPPGQSATDLHSTA